MLVPSLFLLLSLPLADDGGVRAPGSGADAGPAASDVAADSARPDDEAAEEPAHDPAPAAADDRGAPLSATSTAPTAEPPPATGAPSAEEDEAEDGEERVVVGQTVSVAEEGPPPPALPLDEDADAAAVASAVAARVLRIYADRGEGKIVEATGFVVAPDRVVIPHHVIEQSRQAAFRRAGRAERVVLAGVLAADAAHDLALVQLAEPLPLTGLPVREEPASLAEAIYVVGTSQEGGATFSEGRIAETGPALRLTAPVPIELGGGAVVDERGRLVAVSRRRVQDDGRLAPAAPASAVQALLDDAGSPQAISAWAKRPGTKSAMKMAGVEHAAAAYGVVTATACLSTCGLGLCSAPFLGGGALLTLMGCATGAAVLISGGTLLLELIQILTMPPAMGGMVATAPVLVGALAAAGVGAAGLAGAGLYQAVARPERPAPPPDGEEGMRY